MGQESEKKHRKIYLLLIMLLLVAGILLGILYFQSSQEIEKSQKEDAASSKKQEHSMKTNEKAEVNIKEMQAGDVVEDSVITQTGMEQFFYKEELTDEVFARMDGVSYPQNAQIGREELCFFRGAPYGF